MIRWGYNGDVSSVFYGHALETKDHIFASCPVYYQLFASLFSHKFGHTPTQTWDGELSWAIRSLKGGEVAAPVGKLVGAPWKGN
ncbi:unnamed protein product [Linum trigynum]|uniref:Uncharacterized protein n=1 Tax=Linum trigynum TaxID=586398 RepID=A0AAV2DYK8_9ROSI